MARITRLGGITAIIRMGGYALHGDCLMTSTALVEYSERAILFHELRRLDCSREYTEQNTILMLSPTDVILMRKFRLSARVKHVHGVSKRLHMMLTFLLALITQWRRSGVK